MLSDESKEILLLSSCHRAIFKGKQYGWAAGGGGHRITTGECVVALQSSRETAPPQRERLAATQLRLQEPITAIYMPVLRSRLARRHNNRRAPTSAVHLQIKHWFERLCAPAPMACVWACAWGDRGAAEAAAASVAVAVVAVEASACTVAAAAAAETAARRARAWRQQRLGGGSALQ